MFSIIISEKGGAERRESFDRTEINVGRVQGNELMLPKGNVSKRHARLLFRDGRFIVTDLKSTNGTYVNGRKIAQATIVREGDKIYIGDFVIRIDTGAAAPAQATPAPAAFPEDVADGPASGPSPQTSAQIPVPAFVNDGRGSVPDGGPVMLPRPPASPSALGIGLNPSADPPSSSEPSSAAERSLGRPLSPRIEPKSGERQEIISHFPLEHDPDDSILFSVPGPPRVPTGAGATPRASQTSPGPASPKQQPAPQVAHPGQTAPAPQRLAQSPAPVASPDRATSPSAGIAQTLMGPGALAPSPQHPLPAAPALVEPRHLPIPVPEGPSKQTLLPQSIPAYDLAPSKPGSVPMASPRRALPSTSDAPESVDPARTAARRSAVVTLIERVTESVDLRALDSGAAPDDAIVARVDRALRDRVQGMRAQGEIRSDLVLDALVVEARREILEYGPLTPLFADEDVSEIQVIRSDHVVAMQGRRQVPAELGFSSELAVARVVRRLCVAAGKPLTPGETFVERRLPSHLGGGARMFAVLPPAADHGHMLVIRKPQRADLTLEDLVRSGTISRAMAGLFAQCVDARANILVTGAVGAGATSLLGALAAAGATTDRVVVLQEDDELIFNQPHTVSILLGDTAAEGARAVQAAARVRPDRLVVGAFAGPVAAEVVDAMGDGVDGVLAAARAPTLRQAVVRLTADLAATRPGLTPDVAREWLASAFDLVIEIARLRDDRHRVLRVGELVVEGAQIVIRDIFTFAVERTAAGGAVEGSFHPTGVVPGIVDDLTARGIVVDPAIFKRHAGAIR